MTFFPVGFRKLFSGAFSVSFRVSLTICMTNTHFNQMVLSNGFPFHKETKPLFGSLIRQLWCKPFPFGKPQKKTLGSVQNPFFSLFSLPFKLVGLQGSLFPGLLNPHNPYMTAVLETPTIHQPTRVLNPAHCSSVSLSSPPVAKTQKHGWIGIIGKADVGCKSHGTKLAPTKFGDSQ